MLVTVLSLIASSAAFAQGSGVMDKYLDKYWGEKREVKVIQKRLYQKDGRNELGLFGGFIPNDAFTQYYPIGLRYNYYFTEDIGIEVNGSYMFSNQTDLTDWLASKYLTGKEVDSHVPQTYVWNAAVEGLWSPVHGKLGIFTSTLAHFDMHISLGVGVVGSNLKTLEAGLVTDTQVHTVDVTGKVGLGLRLYILDWLTIRVEYRQYFFARSEDPIAHTGGGLAHPSEITIGCHFFLN